MNLYVCRIKDNHKMCDAPQCLTGCAHTYREAREAQKQKEKERQRGGEQDEVVELQPHKPFDMSKLGTAALPDPLSGVFRQFQCDNFDKYMAMMGAGQMSRNMILRSNVLLKIAEVKFIIKSYAA